MPTIEFKDLTTVRISRSCSSTDLRLSASLPPSRASNSCLSSARLSLAHLSLAACLSSLNRSTSDLSLASNSEPGEGVALKWPLEAATERGEVGAL